MTELAGQSNIKPRGYIAWEQGDGTMGMGRFTQVLQALGVPASVLDWLRGKATAADGAAVADTWILRQDLANKVRANPYDEGARLNYGRLRIGEMIQEGYDPQTAQGILRRELAMLGYDPPPAP